MSGHSSTDKCHDPAFTHRPIRVRTVSSGSVLPSTYSDLPSGDCSGQVSPQSTTSTHCPTSSQQTSASSAKSAKSCQPENSNNVDKTFLSVPISHSDKAVNGCPNTAVRHTDKLMAQPHRILAPVIPHSLPMYREPTWLPLSFRFPITNNFRSPCYLPATTSSGTLDGEARFRCTSPESQRPSPSYRPAVDPLEQFMEVEDSQTETTYVEKLTERQTSRHLDANQCAVCLRTLSCRSALLMHYRTHTGERPFRCRLCRRAFTTKGNLKTHMGVHRVKPSVRTVHTCPMCHKQFSNVVILQQHVRLHSPGNSIQQMTTSSSPAPPTYLSTAAAAVHHTIVAPTPLLMTSSVPGYLPFAPFFPFSAITPEPFPASVMYTQRRSSDNVSHIGKLFHSSRHHCV